MPQNLIKILSWNVEHFKADKVNKLNDVIKKIKDYDPDVFGLFEVESVAVYRQMLNNFPKHTMFLTTGQSLQKILVACHTRFSGIKFEQKDKFTTGNPNLRPGVFLTLQEPAGNEIYAFLFLHTDSGTTAVDFGNRTEMFEHAMNLKRTLDKLLQKPAHFIMLGDLNTMGLKYPKQLNSNEKVNTLLELDFLAIESTRKEKGAAPRLKQLTKPVGTHYSRKYGISDLDHVLASDHLVFTSQQNYSVSGNFDIKLDGWRRYMNDKARLEAYANDISDHCLLYFELQV